MVAVRATKGTPRDHRSRVTDESPGIATEHLIGNFWIGLRPHVHVLICCSFVTDYDLLDNDGCKAEANDR